ncbi:MAG: bifunctional phosphoglucose/phosphomannose isomerase [Candidatus Eisenbacteria bacterium]|uniref:Bifunctional phosphoglucose/phosphomannose isomerase n=1 Tax=Eiseniibacteriota bacterium TaxID=2212470 RepID=A0A933SEQ9_UNCEI|nr:bifunctional phosphoglucose/phosphomannose isomerase [Candidatus Eisenbacteria bacterium]
MTPAAPTLEPPYGGRDAHGMAALVDAIPEHVGEALRRTTESPWQLPAGAPELVAVGGMGGSAIASELTSAMYADMMPRPWLTVRDYAWPACVNARSLAVLSSNSGNTEETLALEAQTVARGVPSVALTSGGELARRAEARGLHRQSVPGGMPPRASLFHAWVPMTRLVGALGWAPDSGADWAAAAALLAERRGALGTAAPEGANPAKQLARECSGRTVYVYSSAGPVAAVGVRWRQQLNENAKLLGHSAVVPELNHNEIVGWQAAGDLHRGISVIVLRDSEDPAEHVTRLDLTAQYAARQGASVHEVRSVGESRLARLASLVQFGDYFSLYLALLGAVDPTDISSIDDFKRRLAERAKAR